MDTEQQSELARIRGSWPSSELTIAGLLGHKVAGVTARYAHVPDRALVAAPDAVAGRIAGVARCST